MDLTQTIIAKSDQLNADDLIGGPQTFTVTEVRMGGDSEQPVSIVLAEWPEDRPFKPSKTVLRILVHAWGKESDEWPKGARMTLYRDAGVKWAGQAIGGIRVSHLSHIDGKLKIALQESRGKKVLYTVDPLPDAPAEPATRQSIPETVPAGRITEKTRKQLMATYTKAGLTDRDKAIAWTVWAVGREITSRAELTEAEALQVIDMLNVRIAERAEAAS